MMALAVMACEYPVGDEMEGEMLLMTTYWEYSIRDDSEAKNRGRWYLS